MEPERKIEKLLRADANKRRADAGDAFKLHPATRRMLQGEVARQRPKPAAANSISFWKFFRERWAVPFGFALLIFFGVALFLPALLKPKINLKSDRAMNNLKQVGLAAQIAALNNLGKLPATLDALTNQLVSADALTDTVSGQRFVYVARGANLNAMRSNDVLAYAPENDKDRAVLFADGSVHRVRREEFPALTNRTLLALSRAESEPVRKSSAPPIEVATAVPAASPPALAAPPPATETPNLDEANRAPAISPASVSAPSAAAGEFASAEKSRSLETKKIVPAQNAAKFKAELAAGNLQAGANNSQRYRQTAAKMPPVLASFELQQNGSQISVVDRDGSIYHGSLQPLELADDLAKTSAAVKPGASGLLKKDSDATENGNAPSSAQNFFFRVSGANRSLKQNVVFSGNLIAVPNATANAAQKSGGFGGGFGGQSKLANANAAQQAQSFSNSRIEGTVTIGNTNRVEINAVPVNP
jgi:hypothetical protein